MSFSPNPFTQPLSLLAFSLLLSVSLPAADLLTGETPIAVPNTHGRFDFIEMDQAAGRLLAGHAENKTLDVFDAHTGQLLKSVPTGAAMDAALDAKGGKYYVSVSEEQKIVAVDSSTLEITGETSLPGPADILAFDTKNGLVYAGHDDAADVWAVDPSSKKISAAIPVPEGPEGIVYDEANDRVYACTRKGDCVVVIDPSSNRALTNWSTLPAKSPHGADLDTKGHRLFAAGGNGKLVAIDLLSGKVTGTADIAPKVDEIAYDPDLGRVYCASGSGVLSVVDVRCADLKSLGTIPTHKGAHSVAVDPQTHAVWIAFAEEGKSFIQRLK